MISKEEIYFSFDSCLFLWHYVFYFGTKKTAIKKIDRASPRSPTVNIFALTIVWFLLMNMLEPRVALSPNYYVGWKVIHRCPFFVAAVAVTGHGIQDICDQRSINHRSTTDIDIILSSLCKNTKGVPLMTSSCCLPRETFDW